MGRRHKSNIYRKRDDYAAYDQYRVGYECQPWAMLYHLIMNLSFDIPKLNDCQRDNHDHQYDRLGRRSTEIQTEKTIMINLVHHDVRGFVRPPFSECMDHTEGIKKGVHDVHHDQKKGCGRQQWK